MVFLLSASPFVTWPSSVDVNSLFSCRRIFTFCSRSSKISWVCRFVLSMRSICETNKSLFSLIFRIRLRYSSTAGTMSWNGGMNAMKYTLWFREGFPPRPIPQSISPVALANSESGNNSCHSKCPWCTAGTGRRVPCCRAACAMGEEWHCDHEQVFGSWLPLKYAPLRNLFVLHTSFQELQNGDLPLHAELIPGLVKLVAQLIAYLLMAL